MRDLEPKSEIMADDPFRKIIKMSQEETKLQTQHPEVNGEKLYLYPIQPRRGITHDLRNP